MSNNKFDFTKLVEKIMNYLIEKSVYVWKIVSKLGWDVTAEVVKAVGNGSEVLFFEVLPDILKAALSGGIKVFFGFVRLLLKGLKGAGNGVGKQVRAMISKIKKSNNIDTDETEEDETEEDETEEDVAA